MTLLDFAWCSLLVTLAVCAAVGTRSYCLSEAQRRRASEFYIQRDKEKAERGFD